MAQGNTNVYSRVVASLAGVGIVTFVLTRIVPSNSTTAAMLFMVLVLVISAVWSRAEALTAALAAGVALDYFFLPPTGSFFTISDRNDAVALAAFIACALIGSHLSLAARDRAADASLRQDEMARLYALGRALLLAAGENETGRGVVEQMVQLFGFPGVALFARAENRVYRGGDKPVPVSDDQMSNGAGQSPPAGCVVLALAHEGTSLGTLALFDKGTSSVTLHAIGNLAAAALYRAQVGRSTRA